MSPIDFGPPPFTLDLPNIDVEMIGSYALTVWELANSYSLFIVLFLLVLAVSALGWLYRFVTNRRSGAWEEE